MNMMKTTKLALLAIASAALLTPAARATTISSTYGDLIVGFYTDTAPGQSVNLMVDLGAITQFTNGTSFAISRLVVQDLVDVYGSTWYNRSDLTFGAVGTANGTTGTLGFPKNTLWVTQPSGATYTPGTSSAQGLARAAIDPMYTYMTGKESTTNSAYAYAASNTDTGSWTVQDAKTAGLSFSYFSPSISSAANPGASGEVSLQLMQLRYGQAQATQLGTLKLTASGMSFEAVPEPTSSALVALGIGMVAMFRRKKAVKA